MGRGCSLNVCRALMLVAGCQFDPSAQGGRAAGGEATGPTASSSDGDGSMTSDPTSSTSTSTSGASYDSVTSSEGGGTGQDTQGAVDPTLPFGTPVAIAELNTQYSEDDPTLTADRLHMWFCSNRPGGLGGEDIWFTSRATVHDPWEPPTHVPELASSSSETTVEVSPDGLTLLFSSNRDSGSERKESRVVRD